MEEWVRTTREFINQADLPLIMVGLGFAIWRGWLRLGREYDTLNVLYIEAKSQIKGYERVATVTTQMAADRLPEPENR